MERKFTLATAAAILTGLGNATAAAAQSLGSAIAGMPMLKDSRGRAFTKGRDFGRKDTRPKGTRVIVRPNGKSVKVPALVEPEYVGHRMWAPQLGKGAVRRELMKREGKLPKNSVDVDAFFAAAVKRQRKQARDLDRVRSGGASAIVAPSA